MPFRSILILSASLCVTALLPAVEMVKQTVNVLDLIKSGKVSYHLNNSATQTLTDPPEKIWTFNADGQLKVSGRGFGYVRTNEDYQDYHLVIEYKFTGPTMGSR